MSDSSHPNHGSNVPASHHQPALSAVLVIVILFVAATFFMLRTSPAPSSAVGTSTTLLSTTTSHPRSHVAPKSRVRVQVANGTSTTGLARTYTQRLLTLGWDTLPELNSNKVTSTIIYYNPGYKWAAQQIANEIHAGTHAVRPYNGQSIGFSVSTDDVILLLGPDLAILG